MNLSICDSCESVVRSGEYHRLGTPIEISRMEVNGEQYAIVINTTRIAQTEYEGGAISGFQPRKDPVDLCFNCIRQHLAEAIAKYKPINLKSKELASPDK